MASAYRGRTLLQSSSGREEQHLDIAAVRTETLDDKPSTSTSPARPSPSSPIAFSTETTTAPSRPLRSRKWGDVEGRTSLVTSDPSAPRSPTPNSLDSTSVKSTSTVTSLAQPTQSSLTGQNKHEGLENLAEGQRVRITLINGAEFEGILSTSTSSSCHLRMVQQNKHTADATNGSHKSELLPNMSFRKKDMSETRAMTVKAQNGTPAAFRTDSAISSGGPGAGLRKLQPWKPDSNDNFDGSLESSNTTGTWDQFAANEAKFGIKSDYNENYYTTAIDKNHPQYRERVAAAERKEREILHSAAATNHVSEERKMDYAGGDDGGDDEEDKYSGVKRQQDFPPLPDNRQNKYTPPARRAPAAISAVKGGPVDPAIISSQLKTAKAQAAPKAEESKPRATPAATELSAALSPAAKNHETASETKPASQQKAAEAKPANANQNSTPLKPSAATSRTISPQAKEGAALSATSTVERDVLKEFKTFANQQRMNAEKVRSSKAKADKEVKLTELKKFAESFKLPTLVPADLVPIIAKDPAKQKEIQEKAQRDAAELRQRKVEEAAAKEKKPAAPKDGQTTIPQAASADKSRPSGTLTTAQPAVTARPSGGRPNFVPQPYNQYRNDRQGPHNMPQPVRQGGLAARIRNVETQKIGPDMRQPPTGPANAGDARRMGSIPNQPGAKLNPNSHEFRYNPNSHEFRPSNTFPHPSAGSSPRSAINNSAEAQSGPPGSLVVVTKKKKAVDMKKCIILAHVKSIPVPQGKNWDDNQGIKPSFDTPPTWRQAQDDEKPDSTMRLSYKEYFEQRPFATQPTPNPSHAMPQQLAHQHQLPFHLQHGAHNGARHSPHIPPVQMHSTPHGSGSHSFNGGDDHNRMMHSNSSQSFSSPRMGHAPMYPPNMNSPAQMPYNQNVMPGFMPGTPQMGGQYNRSFSNNGQYMAQQQMPMGTPMMMQPHFIPAQGMPAPQMQMYPPGGQQLMAPGGAAPQPMPGANGYPSPGRPAAPMMVHQGSQQGQPMYGMSPGMQYQQPVYSQQPGQMNNMRGYNNPGPQQFGTSPQQMHQYGPQQQHRNSSNNYKNYQGHNQHQGPQSGHPIPTGPGRTPDGPDETK
ncbi:uncharacterized protein BCR38DRAFT_485491 [Pseudomassariella vexata]|uniref:LsmAD domain-containing protein n=1 Tax=Pseudomassariella vexata TaxID=1141098 RepID=A0A1Y2DYK0_9PEZI|nr:uncharacterized protein BCR38DRAFT_485491 [Pseudomassariella vexata]ORY64333.1 hypothetical protein BCR38DRAFT_485491 [Pseudomassariella vexata]